MRSSTNRGEGSSARDNEYVLEQQNDLRMEDLSNKLSVLQNISIDIHDDVSGQERLLNESHDIFGGLGGTLQNSFGRLNRMVSKRHKRQMCFYVGIAVVVFFIVYWSSGLIKHIPWSSSPAPDTADDQDI